MPDTPARIAPVINPDAPGPVRTLLENRNAILAAGPAVHPVAAALPVVLKGGLVLAAMVPLRVLTTPPDVEPPPGTVFAGAAHASATLHWLAGLWPYAGAAAVLLAGARAVQCVLHRRKLRSLDAATEHYVQGDHLTVPARVLLSRAQRAQSAVVSSVVHRLDLIDRQRNEIVLPVQVWEIASALREYSRLWDTTSDSSSGEVVALQAARRQTLRASRDGVEQRVAALEDYAEQVREADLRYQELQQIQRLTEGNGEAMELLARTAADALAVAEIEAMTAQAAVVEKTFTTALDRASAAAVIALPTRATA
ncbi:hypothetical protein M8Z33_42000 [Streptomyces sp. ZAF1911]|uniref:hypothetical protein n=1 Tax=Streptomyces sp. ZAF1911 TaxID=2944129 RepID=UPI00237B1F20|nr:hypothetical protein [Streptomyces sp. ZAF1911]MDD9383112.1 hypothetical protein [Streptomyces sp. ZAF1911]